VWISCAQQEYQEGRAQGKSDPVAGSDLVDADVGGPSNGETRDGLFWLLAMFKLYCFRVYCHQRRHLNECHQQEEAAAVAVGAALPNKPPSWLLVGLPSLLNALRRKVIDNPSFKMARKGEDTLRKEMLR
jgi:hypothetical protein